MIGKVAEARAHRDSEIEDLKIAFTAAEETGQETERKLKQMERTLQFILV